MSATTTDRSRTGSAFALLSLGALGVVFGDIGTSPLYALRESFEGAGHELPVTETNVLGILSLIFWSLTLVITIKYLIFVMRASNDGEGGILALTALVTPRALRARRRYVLILIGLFGTALLYGDGMITPAISVLSAVEGTEVATPGLSDVVIPISIAILVGLFAVQRFGTGAVGRVFGPVMIVWFTVIGGLGVIEIAKEPGVLRALEPVYAARFFGENPVTGFLALGSVFLVVTGGEALYADMGHFGRAPIAVGWFVIVLPGLLLNYFGQGALLLSDAGAIDNPFYRLAPEWGLYPLVVLATVATVIASQALISGAFSLTRQAAQLGYTPRMQIVHTSAREIGQIYVPAVNWTLMIACVGLVVGFRSSTGLAAAYGVAVTTTMVITTLIFYVVAREVFRWHVALAAGVCSLFLVVDLAFFGANVPKIPHGGWFPIVAGAIVFTLLTTWHTGRRLLGERIRHGRQPLDGFLEQIRRDPPPRVPGTAVYLFSMTGMTPPALQSNLHFNKALHERVFVVAVITDDVPRVEPKRRLTHQHLGEGVHTVELHYGFQEEPDVPRSLARVHVYPGDSAYFLGRETIRATARPGMMQWRERLFAVMGRNATSAASYFHLPSGQVFEAGIQVEI